MQLTEKQELIMNAAKIGYENYCRYTGWKSIVTGDALPEWKNLPGEIKNAWFASAQAVINFAEANIR